MRSGWYGRRCTFHINGVTEYLAYLRFILAVVCVGMPSFFFFSFCIVIPWAYHTLFMPLTVDGHLSCFPLAIMNHSCYKHLCMSLCIDMHLHFL